MLRFPGFLDRRLLLPAGGPEHPPACESRALRTFQQAGRKQGAGHPPLLEEEIAPTCRSRATYWGDFPINRAKDYARPGYVQISLIVLPE